TISESSVMVVDGIPIADEVSMVEFELALFACRCEVERIPDLAPIDRLNMSRVGDPDGFVHNGRFLTPGAIVAYRRYAYVTEFIDLGDVDVVVMVGAGTGEQVEVLKQLHPRLTIVVLDNPVGLYVSERFLSASCEGDV